MKWSYWFKNIKILKNYTKLKNEKDRIDESLQAEFSSPLEEIANRLAELDRDIDFSGLSLDVMDKFKETLFCYANGRALATIATVGITAERISIEQLQKIKIRGRYLTEDQIQASGNLTQEQRLAILKIHGLSPDVVSKLDSIRKKRNDFIHPSKDYNSNEAKRIARGLLKILILVMQDLYPSKRKS